MPPISPQDALARGRARFNEQAFFEAHELWEEAWRELTGLQRIFVQGLIQIAAGLHHLQQGRPRPAARLLGKGLEKLSRGALDPAVDLAVDHLTRQLVSVLAALQAGRAPDLAPLEL